MAVPVTGTIVPAGNFPVANAADIYGLSAYINSNGTQGLQSATTIVTTIAATAPSSGQVLTATSSTTAVWSTPSTTARYLRSTTSEIAVYGAAAPAANQALVATGSAAAAWSYPIAYQLRNATGNVSISSAAAPAVGQTLIATSSTTATWQTPSVVYYGDSSDGDVTVSTDITLTRDMHYHNLTIQNSGSITTDGFRIYVSGTLDISACTSASRIIVGASGGQRRRRGGLGGYITQAAGTYNLSIPPHPGENSFGWGGPGGTGGLGSAGGQVTPYPYRNLQTLCNWLDLSGGGGGGGGAYPTSNSNSGGVGGDGCSGIYIAAAQLTRSSSNAAGTIISTGVAGANGYADNTDNGSGGGGGGGAVVLIVGALSGTSATSLLRSVGGAGSAYGVDSAGGYGGTCILVVVGTSETSAGPTANSTTSGGITSLTV